MAIPDPPDLSGPSTEDKIRDAIMEGTQQFSGNSQQAFKTVQETFSNIDLTEVHKSTSASVQQSVEAINNKYVEAGGPELVEQAKTSMREFVERDAPEFFKQAGASMKDFSDQSVEAMNNKFEESGGPELIDQASKSMKKPFQQLWANLQDSQRQVGKP